jgi:uncharacterized cofD-like protein
MGSWTKWLHPGLRIKRWGFLLVASIVVLSLGLSGLLGQVFRGLRVDVMNPHTLDRLTHQVQSLRFIDFVMLFLGLWGIGFALKRMWFSMLTALIPQGVGEERELVDVVIAKAKLRRGPRVVAIGGGTGLPALLAGLKQYTNNLTAIVTVADDGGSSGRLRRDLKILPPGDLRNCLVALAEAEPLMSKLFQHRFKERGQLEGHSFGNLFIAAMTEVTGDFGEAVRQSSQVLAVGGRVLPVTLDSVSLVAVLEDGRTISGESRITAARGKVASLRLEPEDCQPTSEVLQAIEEADAILLGPGSLYTSVAPNLLVPGVAKAVASSAALKVYIGNVMTQPGETDGYALSDHVAALQRLTGLPLVDYVVANTEAPAERLLKRYALEGQSAVAVDREALERLGVKLVRARLLASGDLLRHDPRKLARVVMRLIVI